MNRDIIAPEMVDEKLLDLLVDGELSALRRRELLRQLDATPGGWRQCAVAFLEAQAWRSDLRTAEQKSSCSSLRTGSASPVRRSLVGRLQNWTILATGVVCAFAGGWIFRPTPAAPTTVRAVAPTVTIAEQKAVAAEGSEGDAGAGEKSPAATDPNGVRVAGILTLKFDDHGHERELKLPVLEGSGIDVREWLDQPSAVNASAVQALERRGHKVESHRQLFTVNLKDGRKLLLPVDKVDVRFAHRVFQ
jgi:hypothetical protein